MHKNISISYLNQHSPKKSQKNGFLQLSWRWCCCALQFFLGEVASDIAQAKCARKPFFFINKKNKGNKGIGTIIPNLFWPEKSDVRTVRFLSIGFRRVENRADQTCFLLIMLRALKLVAVFFFHTERDHWSTWKVDIVYISSIFSWLRVETLQSPLV